MDYLWNHAVAPNACLLLAHGAGAPMDSDFMNALAESLADLGVSVARFEFPYMAQRREGGSRRPPGKAETLIKDFAAHYQAVQASTDLPVWVAGKSMGGRVATLLAAEQPVAGVVVFGYPFHAPGKPDKTRYDHFARIPVPLLICQGERDPFGKRHEVEGYALPAAVRLHWLAEGDHDFKARKSSGRDQQGLIAEAAAEATAFITG